MSELQWMGVAVAALYLACAYLLWLLQRNRRAVDREFGAQWSVTKALVGLVMRQRGDIAADQRRMSLDAAESKPSDLSDLHDRVLVFLDEEGA